MPQIKLLGKDTRCRWLAHCIQAQERTRAILSGLWTVKRLSMASLKEMQRGKMPIIPPKITNSYTSASVGSSSWDNADFLPMLIFELELHDSILECVEGVVVSQTHIVSRVELPDRTMRNRAERRKEWPHVARRTYVSVSIRSSVVHLPRPPFRSPFHRRFVRLRGSPWFRVGAR